MARSRTPNETEPGLHDRLISGVLIALIRLLGLFPYGVRVPLMGWVFDPNLAQRQGAQLAKMVRWFTAAETLRMATADNAQLLALSGKRSSYQA